jgi:L-amino acid N-acyltransferase YncA
VRIEQQTQETIVGISIDEWFRGKALAAQLLKLACADFLRRNKNETIIAYIKESNAGSYKAFIAANFSEINKLEVDGHSSFVMKKTYDEQL